MAQLTEKTLAWMEASVGASATGPPPAESGCPFWSSPSPVPAPQAPSTSIKAAIPQRESKEARVAKRYWIRICPRISPPEQLVFPLGPQKRFELWTLK